MAGSPPDGGTLLDYLQRLTEAVERIADHLTQNPTETMKVEDGGAPPKTRYYGQKPQPESSNAEGIQRPKQAARS